jgi:hypothetical protein
MILFKKIPMKFEKKDYEIRVLYDDATINVVAFLNNYPFNGFRHQIQVPKKFEVKRVLKTEAVKELVEIAKNDIIEKRWEKLLKALA